MENNNFKISIKTVWVLVIGSLLITAFGAYTKIQHWGSSQLLLTIGIILFSSTWIIVISDMAKNRIYNKTFWIMSMFILPSISLLIYLIRRNRLIILGK